MVRPVVATTSGRVQGVTHAEVSAFKGLPYAAPPVGDRRFLPPAPPSPWDGVRDTSAFGAACMQPDAPIVPGGIARSEDCLTANVWTPALVDELAEGSPERRPVMVYLHGGAFVEGSAAEPVYDGADLAAEGVVVVSLQYRFGPFGYLDLSQFGEQYATSANNGLLDQIAGLRWVKENIAAFGGDPGNVTLFGESAGSISVAAILGSPSADGLYHRVILQSGATANIADRQRSQKVSSAFRRLAGVGPGGDVSDAAPGDGTAATTEDVPAQLQALSAEKLQEVADRLYDSEFSDTAFGPVVDGSVVPASPLQRLASDSGPRVPTLITTTRDEARYWIKEVPEIENMPERLYRPWLAHLVGQDRVDAAIAAYRAERPELTAAQVGIALAGDVAFRGPSIRLAETLAHRGVPVWMGLFTTTSPAGGGKYGAPHAIDLGYVFGTFDADPEFYGSGPESDRLSEQVQDWWTSFARDGAPGRSDWPAYDTVRRATLVIDRTTRVVDDPLPGERMVFSHLPYDGSAPTLDDLTPLSYPGTPWKDPRVLLALAGPVWSTVIVAGVTSLLAGAFVGARYLLKRRRVHRSRRSV